MTDDRYESDLHLAENSYKDPHERQAHLDSKYAGRYKVDQNRNFDNYAAVHDTYTNKVYHLHRGTVNGADLATDAGLAFGQLHNTDRYKQTEARVRDTHNAYAGAEHHHIGHSLGGSLADTFARQYKDSSTAYNMGSSPFASKTHATEKNEHHRIGGDFVSSFQKPTGNTYDRKQNKLDTLLDKAHQQVANPLTNNTMLGASLGAAHSLWKTYQSHLLSNFHN